MTARIIETLKKRKRKVIEVLVFKHKGSTEDFRLKREDARSSECPCGGRKPEQCTAGLALIIATVVTGDHSLKINK